VTAIAQLQAREILDSRGVPTIEVDVRLTNGAFGRAAAPSGGSRGKQEALELRDAQLRYGGLGVRRAVEVARVVLAPALEGFELKGPRTLDQWMVEFDGTENRGRLGANTMLAVSLAVTQALAADQSAFEYLAERYPEPGFAPRLPVPMFNVLNGGAHAGNTVDIQEYMVAPVGAPSFAEALRMGVETYRALRSLLKKAGLATSVGDEGGFAPDLEHHTQPLDLLVRAIEHAGLKPGQEVVIAVDVAAGELLEDGTYVFRKSMRRRRSTEQMIQFYSSWLRHYPIWSIEDGLADSDMDGWRALTQALGARVQLVGDDLFVTNTELLRAGIAAGLANAVLIKLNQVGTVSETLDTIAEATRHGYGVVISHRAGETESDFIADLAVATGAGQIKAGAPVRGERVAKYNRLLRIEEDLGPAARFAGRDFVQVGGFIPSGFCPQPLDASGNRYGDTRPRPSDAVGSDVFGPF
jgi:enolase